MEGGTTVATWIGVNWHAACLSEPAIVSTVVGSKIQFQGGSSMARSPIQFADKPFPQTDSWTPSPDEIRERAAEIRPK
jgi:hypothetical protein